MKSIIEPDWLKDLPGDSYINRRHIFKLVGCTSKTSITELIKNGVIPKPIKRKRGLLTPTLRWKISEIREFIKTGNQMKKIDVIVSPKDMNVIGSRVVNMLNSCVDEDGIGVDVVLAGTLYVMGTVMHERGLFIDTDALAKGGMESLVNGYVKSKELAANQPNVKNKAV